MPALQDRLWRFFSNFSFTQWISGAAILLGSALIAPFLCGLLWARTDSPIETAAVIAYWRDLITIAVMLQVILIVMGIAVLVIQIARFVNLLRSEVKPITDDAQQTLKQARATTEFVTKHTAEPIIQTASFFSGLFAFLREIIRLGRILKRRPPAEGTPPHDGN
jgi:membrane protein implicated in regulation of membrane protease activity